MSPDTGLLQKALAKKAVEAVVGTKPTNSAELVFWVRKILGVRAPRWAVTEGAVSPMEFLDAAFFETTDDFVVLGPRDGLKTLCLGTLHFLNSHFKTDCETVHVGAQTRQAIRCYNYVLGFIGRDWGSVGVDHKATGDPAKDSIFGGVGGKYIKSSLQSRTAWANGSVLEILPGTISAVSGPHPQKTAADEVERWDWKTWMQFLGMASSGMTDHKAQKFAASTREEAYGTMNRIISEADTNGFTVNRWTIWDIMEGCKKRFGGCLCRHGDKIYPEKCILYEECKMRAENADGVKKWEEVCKTYRQVDSETWKTQYVCEKPGRGAMVYSDFDRLAHVTEAAEYNPDKGLIIMGLDVGYNSPFCILLGQRTERYLDVFDEWYLTHRDNLEMKRLVSAGEHPPEGMFDDAEFRVWFEKKLGEWSGAEYVSNVALGFLDPHYPAEKAEWCRSQSIDGEMLPSYSVEYPPTHTVREGVRQVRGLIKAASGDIGLRIHPRCESLIWEMESGYHYRVDKATNTVVSDDPVDENNHACDSLRYMSMGSDRPPPGVI